MGRSDKAEPLIENEGLPASAPANAPTSAPAREVLTWERFGEVTRELARDIWGIPVTARRLS